MMDSQLLFLRWINHQEGRAEICLFADYPQRESPVRLEALKQPPKPTTHPFLILVFVKVRKRKEPKNSGLSFED